MGENLPERLERYRGLINQSIEKILSESFRDSPLQQSIAYMPRAGGKRMRPILVCLAAEAAGGSGEDVLPAACAIELLHAASLVLDDLPSMDDARLRRWHKATHMVFGEAQSILSAIALIATCFELLARNARRSGLAEICCAAMIERVAHAIAEAVQGQAVDLRLSKGSVSLEALERCYRLKTGALLAGALTVGATLAHASEREITHLEQFGYDMGIAFQFVDDLLDRKVPAALSGKDLVQGSKDYLEGIDPRLTSRRVDELTTRAADHLAELGPRGEALRALATWAIRTRMQRLSYAAG